MILPTIHLNSTRTALLLKGYRDAYDAIRAAEMALCAIQFNALDYYPAGELAWCERSAMFTKLGDISEKLHMIIAHIQDAEDAQNTLNRRSAA